jgi:hypothetical protein
LEALRRLGQATVPVQLWPGQDPAHWWAVALADNLSRRPNSAEKALMWAALTADLGAAAEGLGELIELPRNPRARGQYLAAARLPARVLLALAQERLDLATAATLAELGPTGVALWDLLETYRPSLQTRRQWLEWLTDLARRADRTPLSLAQELALAPESDSSLSSESALSLESAAAPEASSPHRPGRTPPRPAFANGFGPRLWARRFPQLARLTADRQRLLKALSLPPQVTLKLDPTLEDGVSSLILTFDSVAELSERLRGLQTLLADERFPRLWEPRWPEE